MEKTTECHFGSCRLPETYPYPTSLGTDFADLENANTLEIPSFRRTSVGAVDFLEEVIRFERLEGLVDGRETRCNIAFEGSRGIITLSRTRMMVRS